MKALNRIARSTLAVLGMTAGLVFAVAPHGMAESSGSDADALTFVVTAPVTGYVLPAGSPTDITWTGGPVNERMGIWLVDSDEWVVVLEIATNLGNDGHHAWTIPAGLPPGDYQIYVEDAYVTDWGYGTPFTVY